MKNTVRTFLAVETSDAIRRRAGELMRALEAAGADVKWVAPQNLHLTLKFLDEVPLEEIPRVSEAVQAAVHDRPPFELGIGTAGAFPHSGRPRTLWLGAAAGAAQLTALHDALEQPLARLGFPKEPRRFEPHLTIGRVRGGGPAVAELGRLLKQHADFDGGRCPIAEVVVYSSQLTPQGPIYTVLARARLG